MSRTLDVVIPAFVFDITTSLIKDGYFDSLDSLLDYAIKTTDSECYSFNNFGGLIGRNPTIPISLNLSDEAVQNLEILAVEFKITPEHVAWTIIDSTLDEVFSTLFSISRLKLNIMAKPKGMRGTRFKPTFDEIVVDFMKNKEYE